MGEEGARTELEVQLLRADVEAHAFALQGMERERAMAEELLQAKAQVAELRAEIRIRDAALEAKDATHKAKFALIESELQSKEAALQAQIFGRYAAPGKHLVSGPYPAASQRQHPHSNRRTLNNVHAPLHSESVTVLQQSWHPRLPL